MGRKRPQIGKRLGGGNEDQGSKSGEGEKVGPWELGGPGHCVEVGWWNFGAPPSLQLQTLLPRAWLLTPICRRQIQTSFLARWPDLFSVGWCLLAENVFFPISPLLCQWAKRVCAVPCPPGMPGADLPHSSA